jgi:hypothetical protein
MDLKNSVDKGSNSRAAGQNDQDPEEEQKKDDRQKPELFPHLQKSPEIFQKVHSLTPLSQGQEGRSRPPRYVISPEKRIWPLEKRVTADKDE